MYHKSTFGVDGGVIFYRHTNIDPHRPSLLFIHGLGDSSRLFHEAFFEADLQDFNIIVPDLPGFGKSRPETDTEQEYKFRKQAVRLYKLMDHLEVGKFFLVGHSMGGDLGTLMCTTYDQRRIRAFMNIEGDLTQGDRFITNLAVEAHKLGMNNFETWLHLEMINALFKDERAKFTPSRNRYKKSLDVCSATAFWTSVEEIRLLNENLPGYNFAEAARLFAGIQIPKVFCWGKASVQVDSLTWNYLQMKPFRQKSFDAFHWIMLDQRREFYDFLVRFLIE